MHWYLMIAILGHLPSYLWCFILQKTAGNYLLCSQTCYNLYVPPVRTELCKTAFKYAVTSDWNHLQTD